MSLPSITVSEIHDPTMIQDYPHVPPPQLDENSLKVTAVTVTTPNTERREQRQNIKEEEVKDFDPTIGASPLSPFYRFRSPSTNLGLSNLYRTTPNRELQLQNRDTTDLELGNGDTTRSRLSPWSLLSRRRDKTLRSKLWEGDRRKNGWFHRLDKKQRFAVRLAIAALTVGGMVGVAFGIPAAAGSLG